MEMMQSKLFEGISAESCARMVDCFGARELRYTSGQIICEFDGKQRSVGILLAGSAEIIRIDEDGNRTLLESLEEGGVFGEVLSFSSAPHDPVYVECTKDCKVMFIAYDQITKRCENACEHHSMLVQNLFTLLSAKTLRLSERVEVLSQRSIREKLMCYFHQQSLRSKSRSFVLPFSFSVLADYISVDRSAMMREMKKMREEGLIKSDNRKITLPAH